MFKIENLNISTQKFISELEKENIFALSLGKNTIRMVTHRGIKKEHIEKTANVIANISK